MRILADTNVVARLAQPSHHHHATARQALEVLRSREDELCIVPQVIYEFWVVGTRPLANNGLGMTVREVIAEIAEIKALFRFFRDERAVFQAWEKLVEMHEVKGKSAHDARLVAAMKRHGLSHLLTFNRVDFSRFPGITVLTPQQILG